MCTVGLGPSLEVGKQEDLCPRYWRRSCILLDECPGQGVSPRGRPRPRQIEPWNCICGTGRRHRITVLGCTRFMHRPRPADKPADLRLPERDDPSRSSMAGRGSSLRRTLPIPYGRGHPWPSLWVALQGAPVSCSIELGRCTRWRRPLNVVGPPEIGRPVP